MGSVNVIEQIHHEFKTAYLKTYQDLQEVCAPGFEENQNYERIQALGFTNNPKIQKYFKEKKAFRESESMLEQIKRFKIDYPTKKFITFNQAVDIIRKYKLVIGSPDEFIGDFPDKNIKDVLNFQLKEQDINIPNVDFKTLYKTKEEGVILSKDENGNVVGRATLNPENLDRLSLFGRRYTTEVQSKIVFDGYFPNNHFFQDTSLEESIKRIKNRTSDFNEELFRNNLDSYTNKNKVMVIGTPDQFDISRNRLSKFEGAMKTEIFLKDDPIVLKPVNNGFIIITAWGDEAQLPEIKDHTLN